MSSRRKTLLTFLVVSLVAALSVLGVSVADAAKSGHTRSDAGVATPTITISSFAFHTPASVPHGALINVVNKDAVKHTVTSNASGKFNVVVPAHSTRSFHAPIKGNWKFHCTIHPTMTGILHVT